ncbi:MAG: hypothetical protein KF691_09915 [Phycisphaeraceae bacterium]|nr:hypothetical protein [Phycisphaeraceae bacterium]
MFFGPTGPGPFSLLGLEPREIEPLLVLQALHTRLAELAKHPQSSTPAGEEVSLALHAAAAQLCDPANLRVLLRIWKSEHSRHSSQRRSDAAPLDFAPTPIELAIERDLHIAVGLSGGWNAQAMQRLAMACRAKGVEPGDAVRAVQWAGRNRNGPSQAHLDPPAARTRIGSRNTKRELPPEDRNSSTVGAKPRGIPADAIILLGIGGLGIVLFATAIILLTPARRPEISKGSSAENSAISAPLEITRHEPSHRIETSDSNELAMGNPRAIAQEFAGATHDLATDATNAHNRFARAYEAFGKSWTLMSADEISSIVSAIVDFCYGAARLETPVASTVTRPLHQSLSGSKSAVRAAAAAAAITGRLLSEKELPRAFLDQVQSGATIGDRSSRVEISSAFRVGLERNLSSLALLIAADCPTSPASWEGFVEVRDLALGDRQPATDMLTLNALESLLRNSAVQPQELSRSVGVLASSLSWRPSEELQATLSGWLEDATVSAELLTEVTRAMVASSAPGVDSTMVLPPGAGPEARSNLRERLASAWQGKTITSEPEEVAAWATWAERLLDEVPKNAAERLWTAARISQAILAGEELRAGRADRTSGIIAADSPKLPAGFGTASADVPRPDPNSKALEYAAAGVSVQGRLEVLKQFQSSNASPDSLFADVLVVESARGSPASIRDLARSEVRKHSSEPSIVLATLRLLPQIPETPENADWVAEVAKSPGNWKKRSKWKDAAQVAMLDRAIAIFPVSPDETAIDIAAAQLADSWADRAGDESVGNQRDPAVAIEALEASMATATRSIRGAPAGLSISDIRRRLAARSEIAVGPLERAVALQSACVEWTALNVARERPSDLGRLQQMLESWKASRRSASTGTGQLLEGERVMLRMQLLRMGRKGNSA